jgi:hypothetical protein
MLRLQKKNNNLILYASLINLANVVRDIASGYEFND